MFESRATRHVAFVGRHLNALLETHSLDSAFAQLDSALPEQYADDRNRLRSLLVGDVEAPQPLGLSSFATLCALMPEQADQRTAVFRGFMDYQERSRGIFSAYWSGMLGLMAYLSAIALAALVVVSIYFMFVAPQFASMYRALGAKLPGVTASLLQAPGGKVGLAMLLVILVLAGCAATMVLTHRRIQQLAPLPAVPRWVPVIGRLAATWNFGLFINFARVLIAAGVPPQNALAKAASVAQQPAPGSEAVGSGALGLAVDDAFGQELAIAARLGQLELELEHACDEHVGTTILALSRVRDRFALLLKLALFVVVGGVIVAMYLPIFRMGSLL